MTVDDLTILNEPYFHLAVSKMQDFIDLYSTFYNSKKDHVVIRYVDGNKCTTIDSLFCEFSKALEFPDYFGYNWAAFDECINDLSWLPAGSYIILISNIDTIQKALGINFNVLIETLMRAVNEWTDGREQDSFPTPPTSFHVIFQCSEEDVNMIILSSDSIGLKDTNFDLL